MSDNKIVNFQEKRQEHIERKKRSFERVMFDDFLGCSTEIDSFGSNYPIEMVNLSKDGCMFQIPKSVKGKKKFMEGDELNLRIYFTKTNYIPLVVNIRHGQEFVDKNGNTHLRYGCQFNKEVPSFKAVESFVNFLYSFAEHSCQDKGESKVFFL